MLGTVLRRDDAKMEADVLCLPGAFGILGDPRVNSRGKSAAGAL